MFRLCDRRYQWSFSPCINTLLNDSSDSEGKQTEGLRRVCCGYNYNQFHALSVKYISLSISAISAMKTSSEDPEENVFY